MGAGPFDPPHPYARIVLERLRRDLPEDIPGWKKDSPQARAEAELQASRGFCQLEWTEKVMAVGWPVAELTGVRRKVYGP